MYIRINIVAATTAIMDGKLKKKSVSCQSSINCFLNGKITSSEQIFGWFFFQKVDFLRERNRFSVIFFLSNLKTN